MMNLLRLFMGIVFIQIPLILLSQNPVISPEVRSGGFAIQKQASTDNTIPGGNIVYTITFSLPANSGPVILRDNFLVLPPVNIYRLSGVAISPAVGLNVITPFPAQGLAGNSTSCVVENTSNQAITSSVTIILNIPDSAQFDGINIGNVFTIQQGSTSITTEPVYTTIASGPILGGGGIYTDILGRFNFNHPPLFALTDYQLCDTANVHLIATYAITVSISPHSLTNLTQQNPTINFNIPNITLPTSSYSGRIINISQIFTTSGPPIITTIGSPTIPVTMNNTNATIPLGTITNSNLFQQFIITVDWGTARSVGLSWHSQLFNPVYTINGLGLNGTINPITRNFPQRINFLPTDTILNCDLRAPTETFLRTRFNNPIQIGCHDNSFESSFVSRFCSKVKKLEYEMNIPPNMNIIGLQFATNRDHNLISNGMTATVYDYNNTPYNVNANYIQPGFTQFNLAQSGINVPIQRIKFVADDLHLVYPTDRSQISRAGLSVSFYLNQNFVPGTYSITRTNKIEIIDSCDRIFRRTKVDTATYVAIPGEPRLCVWKANCNPTVLYNSGLPAVNGVAQTPGDRIKFATVVMNTGSVPLSNAFLEDLLPPGLTYVQNSARLFVVPANSGIDVCRDHPQSGSPITPVITIDPATGRDRIRFNYPQPLIGDCINEAFFGASCQNFTTRYGIVFEAEAGPETQAGVDYNTYTIGGVNAQNGQMIIHQSPPAGFNIAPRASSTISKSIVQNGQLTNNVSVVPGSIVRFRLNYTNTSNFNFNNVKFIDLLPLNNGSTDGFGFNRSVNRGSNIGLEPLSLLGCNFLNSSGNIVGSASPSVFVDATPNIHLQELGVVNANSGVNAPNWAPMSSTNLNTAKNIKWEFGNLTLLRGHSLQCDYEVQVPASSSNGAVACNSFVASSGGNVNFSGSNISINTTPIESQPVCINVAQACDCAQGNSLTTTVGVAGTRAVTWECEKSYALACDREVSFRANFNCNNVNCPPIYSYRVVHMATGTTVAQGNAGSFNLTLRNSGTYQLIWTVICGDRQCTVCVQNFKVTCAAPACDCNRESTVRVSAENLTEKKSADIIECGKEISANCRQRIRFNASYTCSPNLCASRFEYTLSRVEPGFTAIAGTAASFTHAFNENGTYVLQYLAYCGNTICNSCKIIIKVDNCIPPCNTCNEDELSVIPDKEGASIQTTGDGTRFIQFENSFIINAMRNITEVTATVTDFMIRSDDPSCSVPCMQPFMAATPYATSINAINPVYPDGTISVNQWSMPNNNPRELIWRFLSPARIVNQSVGFTYSLPLGSQVSCCRMVASFCVRLRFVDDKCRVCERTYCVSVPISSTRSDKQEKLKFQRKM